jgi:Ras-related protein Rab-5C
LDKAKTWITELQRQANPNIVIALVGNKADLIDDTLSTGAVKGDAEGEGEGTELVSPFGTKSAGTQGDDDDNDNDNDDEEGEERNVEPTSTTTEVKSSNARQVSKEEVEVYAREQGGILLFEASAKTGKGVQEVFTEIGQSASIILESSFSQNTDRRSSCDPSSQEPAYRINAIETDRFYHG